MLQFLATFAWLACIVYATIPAFWLGIHPFADFWRARRRNPFFLLVPLWIGLWVALGCVTAPWRHLRFYSAPAAWLPAAVLLAVGMWIYRRAGAGFSWSQLGGLPEVMAVDASRQKLAVAGIRARVRHPIYLAHFLEMVAWSAGSGLVVCFGLTALGMATGAVMIWMEDRELEQRFGEEYRRYRKVVPAVIPRMSPYNPE